MTTEKIPELSPSKERLANGLQDALQSMRSLLIAIVALAITIAETRPKSKEDVPKQNAVQPKKNLQVLEQSQILKSPQPMPQVQTKEIPNTMTKVLDPKTTPRELIRNHTYPALAAISTFALVIGVARLGPIAEWAKTQNECIEKTLTINGIQKADLPDKVMTCNGGHAY